ncbi:MAG: hypothetical protein DRJ26_01100 [Candidatus Methanomethylicota archaeon]|uniref:VWFA domain-containing protein n=1 Tax=Thermoproteota archaeon TaxID=2056631 RepID=A0A497F6X7_9CREN|nr:MAG: hypothetical protein DRJ26_01100 [Candidatus Verstraetearchaeota archaeon]
MEKRRPVYPFSAIVGQKKLKLALLANLVDPTIGGLLVVGPKGSGKSTAVRAIVDLLPEIEIVADCPFNCDPHDPKLMCDNCRARYELRGKLPTKRSKMPFVELPLSATEDRVLGTVDFEKAIREGIKALQPGLLGEANRGILYIDEVNLLPDNISDSILDAASSGWNHIEREGINFAHPCKFILIGTMNIEEGWLRPQILDRFPLCVKVEEISNPKDRMEIMIRNLEFEEDPENFISKWKDKQNEVKESILRARKLLPQVKVPEELEEMIAEFCVKLKVDGHRPEIAIIKTARAIAALNGRTQVSLNDVIQASELALAHRSRRGGLEEPLSPEEIEEELLTTITKKEKEEEEEEIKQIKVEVSESGKLPSLPSRLPRKPKKEVILPRLLSILIIFGLYYLLFYFAFAAGSIVISGIMELPWEETVRIMQKDLLLWSAIALLIFTLLQGLSNIRRGKIPYIEIREPPVREYSKIKAHRLLIKEHIVEGPPKKQIFGKRVWQFISLFGAKILKAYTSAIEKGRKIAESMFDLMAQPQSTFKISLTPEHMRGKRDRAEVVRGIWLKKGKYVKHAMPREKPWDIALAPTLRAAAPYQKLRKPSELAIKIDISDLRVKVREYRAPLCIVILLDMSESMITSLENVKNAIRGLHKGAYRHRDRVGLVVFKGTSAKVVQQPTTNLRAVVKKLLEVGASDFTPLAAGMLKAYEVLKLEKLRNKEIIPVLVIISDGIANVPLDKPLSPELRRKFLNPAQADVIDVARRIAKDKIRTIIINTDHRPDEIYKKIYHGAYRTAYSYTPTALLMEIARITRGKYYGLRADMPGETIVIPEVISEITEAPTRLEDIFGPIE